MYSVLNVGIESFSFISFIELVGGCQSPLEKLRSEVENDPELKRYFGSLPETFEIYGDLLLLPSKSLTSYDDMLLTKLCDTFRKVHIF